MSDHTDRTTIHIDEQARRQIESAVATGVFKGGISLLIVAFVIWVILLVIGLAG